MPAQPPKTPGSALQVSFGNGKDAQFLVQAGHLNTSKDKVLGYVLTVTE